ncbi:hypothetical protein [Nocardiopsis composta]|uniref:Uncharacterized protein n=1 Tax=Nocardiopsis composta TaxID=157465 RepID=A0A7W8QM64_9ACTN|nr:hypothetical protein [Nocardiopsis composta]MBB5432348.1 hypothetical protein [Nocardiopsis composta]
MSATAPPPRSMPWLRTCLVVLFVTTAVRSWKLYAGLPDHPYFTVFSLAAAVPGITALLLAVFAGRQSRLAYFCALLTSAGLLGWTLLVFDTYLRLMVDVGIAQLSASAIALALLLGKGTRGFYFGRS